MTLVWVHELLFPACWKEKTLSCVLSKGLRRCDILAAKIPPPNMSREYGTRSRVAAEQGVSKVVDLPAYSTEESAGPSRPSKRDPPAQVRTYPPWWPYWDDNGTPIPAPLSANGEGKASPSSPQVLAAAERTHGPSNPSASGQPIMEGQESSGQEHHHEPESAWLRRELQSLSKLREQGHSFHEISEELLKLGYGKLAGRDAKACELKWSDFHEKKNFIRYVHLFGPVFLSRDRSLG